MMKAATSTISKSTFMGWGGKKTKMKLLLEAHSQSETTRHPLANYHTNDIGTELEEALAADNQKVVESMVERTLTETGL